MRFLLRLPVRSLLWSSMVGALTLTHPVDAQAQSLDGRARHVAELDGLRTTWVSAYEAGDAEAMWDLYSEQAVRMPYEAPALEGRRAIVDGYRDQFAARRLFPTIRLLPDDILIEDRTAIERGRYDELLSSRDGSMRLRERGKYVSIARLGADDRWRYAISIFNRDGPRGDEP